MHFQLQNENLGVSRIIGSENVACVPAQKGGEGGEGAPATNTHIVIGPQMSTINQSEISREACAFLHWDEYNVIGLANQHFASMSGLECPTMWASLLSKLTLA